MTQLARTFVAILFFVLLAGWWQAHGATFEQAQALADKAAALIKAEGGKAFPRLVDPNGGFIDGELYITVIDTPGIVKSHPNKGLIGVNMIDAKDPDGVMFTQELLKAVANSETGMTTYKYVNPATKKIEPKKAWVHKVGNYVVLCGAYVKD